MTSIIGRSPALVAVRQQIILAATSDIPVLIRGETGTGKELVARAIHRISARAKGRLIDVNCAALAESIVESELFGHERGSFTGAMDRHRGKFEQANGGTIFLDEIGDMPLITQAKFLRVLQEGCFFRVGGSEPVTTDTRVICATNKSLRDLMEKHQFRQDLYYRIVGFVIEIPPLRERPSDLSDLVDHFLAKFKCDGISQDAYAWLRIYDWPGNVRELENTLRYAALVSQGQTIRADHLPPLVKRRSVLTPSKVDEDSEAQRGFHEVIANLERELIIRALRRFSGNRTKAAEWLRITRRILQYKMEALQINWEKESEKKDS